MEVFNLTTFSRTKSRERDDEDEKDKKSGKSAVRSHLIIVVAGGERKKERESERNTKVFVCKSVLLFL